MKTTISKGIICSIFLIIGSIGVYHWQKQTPSQSFWDGNKNIKASYLYSPGLLASEALMGRYCPSFTAMTGEKVIWKQGGHVIGQPHSCVLFPDVNLSKPTNFTFNPLTAFINRFRKDLYPLIQRFFHEKFGITVTPNPASKQTVANYIPNVMAANIGQKKDIEALHKSYHRHIKNNPETDIILYGDSRGAATIFNFITQYKPKKVKAAILEGIFDSVEHCVKHFIYNDKNQIAEERLHQALSLVMRKYRKDGINPRKNASAITDSIPLLFVTSLKDTLVAPQATFYLYKTLKDRGFNNIHLLVLQDSSHPLYMLDDPEDKSSYERVVHAFYQHYGLPHNAYKASQGATQFANTQPTAKELSNFYPLPTCTLCYKPQSENA